MYDKCKLYFYLGYKCVQFCDFPVIIQKQHMNSIWLLSLFCLLVTRL